MLTKKELCDIHCAISITSGLPNDAMDFVSMLEYNCFDPDRTRRHLEHNLDLLNKYITEGERDNKDVKRDAERATFIKELIKVLFSDYDDMPLCINETFACIAKIRLNKSI